MKCSVTITGAPFIISHFAASLKANPPKDKHGQAPERWDAHISVDPPMELFSRDADCVYVEPREATATINLVYPEPGPDIPALIKAWHASPTEANRRSLVKVIENHGSRKPGHYPSFKHDDSLYVVKGIDEITVGMSHPE